MQIFAALIPRISKFIYVCNEQIIYEHHQQTITEIVEHITDETSVEQPFLSPSDTKVVKFRVLNKVKIFTRPNNVKVCQAKLHFFLIMYFSGFRKDANSNGI